MEQEKIIYFYPIAEKQGIPGNLNAVRRFWSRNVMPDVRFLCEIPDEADVIGCAIPPYYHRGRPWKPQILAKTMEQVVRDTDGLTDTVIHPQIAAMLSDAYSGRWIPRKSTLMIMARHLTKQYAAAGIRRSGEAAVLLGEAADMDWQMEMTRELLQPYLPRINKLVIFYEETPETDSRMQMDRYTDEYYYDYGLVPQPEAYAAASGGDGYRCRKHRCEGVILDYSGQFRYPKIMPDSRAVYIDLSSEDEKERLLSRKTPQTLYVSPLKYLDTMVKNSYDRLVN